MRPISREVISILMKMPKTEALKRIADAADETHHKLQRAQGYTPDQQNADLIAKYACHLTHLDHVAELVAGRVKCSILPEDTTEAGAGA